MPFILQENNEAKLARLFLLDSDSQTRVEIHLFGATITSWKTSNGQERLFVSSQAIMDGSKAIRGGIPVVFPQFGQPDTKLAQHGFARSSLWALKDGSVIITEESITVVLTLCDTEVTRAVWPHRFNLDYTITLTKSNLTCSLAANNTDIAAWECHTLLHTYFAITTIKDVRVSGFQNRNYQNKVKNGQIESEGSTMAIVDCEVDKVFVGSAEEAPMNTITICAMEAPLVTSEISASLGTLIVPHDVVFWNAWVDKVN